MKVWVVGTEFEECLAVMERRHQLPEVLRSYFWVREVEAHADPDLAREPWFCWGGLSTWTASPGSVEWEVRYVQDPRSPVPSDIEGGVWKHGWAVEMEVWS